MSRIKCVASLAKALISADEGRGAEAQAMLAKAIAMPAKQPVNATEVAQVYAELGEKDKVFEWLDKAYREQSPWLTGIKVSPLKDKLREDPRYEELMGRIGLVQ